jgi:hypothetical protein
MSRQEVRSPSRTVSGRERTSILLLAGLILGGIGIYLALRVSGNGGDTQKDLLPYQVLARTLPAADQEIFAALRGGLAQGEAIRAREGRWPDPRALAGQGIPPFAGPAAQSLQWEQFQQGKTVDYFAVPKDAASPAWLLIVQEPEPNMPPDPAPLDDEHHRLPDGTTLHIYVWMHRIGGRVPARYVPQPQSEGWTELFATPPSPVRPPTPLPTSRN